MDEEDIYIVTRWRIRYKKESEIAREAAINTALAAETKDEVVKIIRGPYTIERCNTMVRGSGLS